MSMNLKRWCAEIWMLSVGFTITFWNCSASLEPTVENNLLKQLAISLLVSCTTWSSTRQKVSAAVEVWCKRYLEDCRAYLCYLNFLKPNCCNPDLLLLYTLLSPYCEAVCILEKQNTEPFVLLANVFILYLSPINSLSSLVIYGASCPLTFFLNQRALESAPSRRIQREMPPTFHLGLPKDPRLPRADLPFFLYSVNIMMFEFFYPYLLWG